MERRRLGSTDMVVTHLAFYAGWPSAMSAARVVKQVFEENKA